MEKKEMALSNAELDSIVGGTTQETQEVVTAFIGVLERKNLKPGELDAFKAKSLAEQADIIKQIFAGKGITMNLNLGEDANSYFKPIFNRIGVMKHDDIVDCLNKM